MVNIEKIILHTDECDMAVKFNYRTQELIMGGYAMFRSLYESMLEIYFGVENIPDPQFPKTNKIKYTAPITTDMYKAGLEKIRKHDIPIVFTRKHGDLLR